MQPLVDIYYSCNSTHTVYHPFQAEPGLYYIYIYGAVYNHVIYQVSKLESLCKEHHL